jgi:hypothetical protein
LIASLVYFVWQLTKLHFFQSDSNPGSTWHTLERIVFEQIRSVESVVSTKTCQSVFGPRSNNVIKPSAISGERVRTLLPIENPFQTPFLLKKVHLLWKFTTAEGVIFTNDSREVSDAGNVVIAEMIDSVTLDKNGRVILELGLSVVAMDGELSILGVSYGIRAQFPQSEATDYTIRGKQYFTVKGIVHIYSIQTRGGFHKA